MAFSLEKYYGFLTSPIVILVVGAILLSIASLTGLPIGDDESNWSITARMWADDGLLPYRDVITNKTPGIFLVNYASFVLFGDDIRFARLLAVFAVLLTALLIYYLVKKIGNQRAAALATWLFVLLSPLDFVDGGFMQTETLMNLFRILSFFALMKVGPLLNSKVRPWFFWMLVSGLCFGLAISFKQIALLDIVPLAFFIWWLSERNLKQTIIYGSWFSFGAITAVFLSVVPILLSGGAMSDYLDGAWLILFDSGIISASLLGRVSGFIKNYFEANLFLIIAATAAFILLRKKISQSFAYTAPLIVWAVTDFVNYNLQGQYFDHHHKVLLLSGVIIFGITADFILREIGQKNFGPVLITALILFYTLFQPDYFHYLRNWTKGLYGSERQLLAEEVKKITEPEDYIYVWGNIVGPIYYYADRRPASRQYLEALLGRPGALAELKSDLIQKKPKLIIVPDSRSAPGWLLEIIQGYYQLTFKKYGFSVYGLIPLGAQGG